VTIILFVTIFKKVRKLLNPTFASQWMPHLKNAVFRAFLDMTDQELKEIPKKAISYMISMNSIWEGQIFFANLKRTNGCTPTTWIEHIRRRGVNGKIQIERCFEMPELWFI